MAGVPRASIPLRTKLDALRRLDEGSSLRKIAKEFGVGRTTVFEWRKNRAEIENFCERLEKKGFPLNDTRMSRRLHEQHDDLMYEWYAAMRRRGVHVTAGALREKALEINRKLHGPADFMASEGWLEKWKWRHKVRLLDARVEDVTVVVAVFSAVCGMSAKRSIADECRVFRNKWTDLYFFVRYRDRENRDKPICLICREVLAWCKAYNVKRHYVSKHSSYETFVGISRAEKIHDLKESLVGHRSTFVRHNEEAEFIVRDNDAYQCPDDSFFSDGFFVAKQKLGLAFTEIAPRLEERVLNIMESIIAEYSHDNEQCFNSNHHDSLPVQEQLRDSTGPASPTVAPTVQPQTPAAIREAPSPVNQQPTTEGEKDPDEVCLRWNSHHTNMKCSFPSLLEREQYVDVTLCAEGQSIRCHRLILSSCSSYFEEILAGITPLQHPVIILRGIQYWILKSLIDFMYVGEVHIEQAKLQEILEVAEILKIKGLTGKTPPKPEVKEEPKPAPATEPPPLVATNNAKPQKSAQPVRVAVTKEQAASMTIVDPLSLLKPTFYEETSPPATSKKSPVPIRPRPPTQTANESPPAAIVTKQKDWVSKRILTKKKLKRKSTEHEPSPPPVILRKGTKSRPIVKAPKYYHMEYEEKDEKQVKEEGGDGEHDAESATLQFDPLTVKSEPVDMDIEDNDIESHPEPEDNDDEANAFIASEHYDDTGTAANKDAPVDPLKDKTNQGESNRADSNG